MLRRLVAVFAVSLILATHAVAPASAQNGNLPGGANALSETFKDWTVRCRAAPDAKTDAKQAHKKLAAAGGGRLCVLWQQQMTQKGQRILTVELKPEHDGVQGAMVLPFGLKLAKGVLLQIDTGPKSQPFAFSTCLPAGCVVPLRLGADAIASLRGGHQLAVLATTLDGKQLKLTVSLAGFGSAYDRVQKLTN